MLFAEKVPTLDEGGSSSQDYDKQVRLRLRMTQLEPPKRAAALILRRNLAARQTCMPAGGDHLESHDGALRILEI